MKSIKNLFILMIGVALAACSGECKKEDTTMKAKEPYKKKYTNADFYKDGKLVPEVALQAYLDMFDYYGVPYSDFVKNNLWITDFELGDFENVGMAGLFWVNDSEHQYFGHEIYLLPSQMILEHRHVPTEGYPAKFESWQVRHGWAYNYSIGETTPGAPALPGSQNGFITVSHFQKQQVDEVIHLAEAESSHFLFAGPEGAIITEYANYHDGNGLRFTNPKAVFTNALENLNN